MCVLIPPLHKYIEGKVLCLHVPCKPQNNPPFIQILLTEFLSMQEQCLRYVEDKEDI